MERGKPVTGTFRSLYGLSGIITHRSAVIRLNTNRWVKGKINRPIGERRRGRDKRGRTVGEWVVREPIGRRGMRSGLTAGYTWRGEGSS